MIRAGCSKRLATAGEPAHTGLARLASVRFGHQPRLADARVAQDGHDAADPGVQALQRAEQRIQLGATPDQRGSITGQAACFAGHFRPQRLNAIDLHRRGAAVHRDIA